MIRFGPFEVDLRNHELRKHGLKLKLQQQPFQVLVMLLERAGELVTREELHSRLWAEDTVVDFDHGLNAAVRRLREALNDTAGTPRFVETLPRLGYRFIAPVSAVERVSPAESIPEPAPAAASPARRRALVWCVGAGACIAFVLGGWALYRSQHHRPEVRYTQLTDFTDSAVQPTLSPDGRMLAFIRGNNTFLTSDQIYVKMLPNGEARQVTDDNRPKYSPAFSPDGSEIAYTVMDGPFFSTYQVSTLGGASRLLQRNAAGLVWLNPERLLFSEAPSGIHLSVVTASPTRTDLREIYSPSHERGMAHYSLPSPDRRWALVVEMNGSGEWAPCRLVSLDGQRQPRSVGPMGACTSAGWSPDGEWMYFTAWVAGQSHIWRQRFSGGAAEQITFGPTEEEGVAVEPDGRALITSLGVHESAIWIHDAKGERSLSSEGEVAWWPNPVFSPDTHMLYYLLRRGENSALKLWRSTVDSGEGEEVFPAVSMTAFDISPDGKQVLYASAAPDGKPSLWVAPVDRSLPATR